MRVVDLGLPSLTSLDRIAARRCRFTCLPLALEGEDGSSVRAIAPID